MAADAVSAALGKLLSASWAASNSKRYDIAFGSYSTASGAARIAAFGISPFQRLVAFAGRLLGTALTNIGLSRLQLLDR